MSKVIAVDLGGTNLRVALLKKNKILKLIKKRTPKNKKLLLDELVKSIEGLMCFGVRKIGVACPGPLLKGIIKNPPNLALKNFDLENFLKQKFRKKVIIENDANCVALAEAKFGCKKNNFIILTLGTGVGGGIIIDGKLYTGNGYGGELGHIILNNKKDLEWLWKSYRNESKKYFGKKFLIKDLINNKQKKSRKILNKTSDYLSQGIGSLINIFDPEVVVLAGGLKESGNIFLNMIKKKVKKYTIIPRNVPIIWSSFEYPGVIGAGILK